MTCKQPLMQCRLANVGKALQGHAACAAPMKLLRGVACGDPAVT